MQDFRNLRVWQHAHQFRLEVYIVIRSFPSDERFGLTNQVRRSAASIAANIAESCGYRGRKDSARFLRIALGSNCETLNHLIAARDLSYLSPESFTSLDAKLELVRRMLIRLMRVMGE